MSQSGDRTVALTVFLPESDRTVDKVALGEDVEVAWERLCSGFDVPHPYPRERRNEIAAQRIPAWSFALFQDGTRGLRQGKKADARAESIHGLIVDYDDA